MISFRISKQLNTNLLLTLFFTTALLLASPAVGQQYQFSDQVYQNNPTWSPIAPQQSRFHNAGFQQQSASTPKGESEPDEIDLEELAKQVAAVQKKDLPAYTAGYDG